MNAKAYDFILISGSKRTTRKIIAHGPEQAAAIGIRMITSIDEHFRITCKPARTL